MTPSEPPLPYDSARRPEPEPSRSGSHEPNSTTTSRGARAVDPPMPAPSNGPRRRLARQLREAALRATPSELVDLQDLERLVRCEALNVFEAQRILTDLIREQHDRDQRAA